MSLQGFRRPTSQEDDRRRPGGGTLQSGTYLLAVEKMKGYESDKNNDCGQTASIVVKAPEEFKGKKLGARYPFVVEASEKVEEIGQQQFAQLVRACGLDPETIRDADDLNYCEFVAYVGWQGEKFLRPDENGVIRNRNEIKYYYYPDDKDIPPESEWGPDGKPEPKLPDQASGGGGDRGRDRNRDRSADRRERDSRDGGRDGGRGGDRDGGRDSRGGGRDRGDEGRDRGGDRGRQEERGGRDGGRDNRDSRDSRDGGRYAERDSRQMEEDIPFDEGRGGSRDNDRRNEERDERRDARSEGGSRRPWRENAR